MRSIAGTHSRILFGPPVSRTGRPWRLWCAVFCLGLILASGGPVRASETSEPASEPAIFKMARIKDTVDVAEILDQDPEAVKARDRYGSTPLHWAAWRGHEKMVNLLLDRGAQVGARNSFHGATPVHDAARRGKARVVQILLDRGADPLIQDDLGRTPLDMAEMRGHHDVRKVIEAFIQAHRPVPAKPIETHPVLTAARRRDLTEVTRLVETDPKLVEMADQVNYQTRRLGMTFFRPLHWAVWNNDLAMVLYLTKKGANLQDRAADGAAPLHLAAERGHVGLVALLIENGAYVRAKDLHGETPLHYAARGEFAHRGRDLADVAARLIKAGAEVNRRNDRGATPLALAYYYDNAQVAAVLRAAGGVTSKTQPLDARSVWP